MEAALKVSTVEVSSRYRVSSEEGMLVLPWGAEQDKMFVRDT